MSEQTKQIAQAKDSPINTIRALLDKSRGQIAAALPAHMNAERMLRVAMTSVQRTPKLLECNPLSLIGAIIQSSQLGLEPDGVLGHAYLIPYGKVVQFIPGYKGLIDLARRSGKIVSIEARAVRQKDLFKFSFGLNPVLEHLPSTDQDPGPAVYFYAVAKLTDGGYQFDVMTKADVEKIRARSKAASSGPWVTDYEEMGKKTVLRRLCKLLPTSVEVQRAIALDERAEIGLPQNLQLLADPDAPIEPDPDLTAGAGDEIPMPQRASAPQADPAPQEPGADAAPEPQESAPGTGSGRKMAAKFPSKCVVCDGDVAKGSSIFYSPDTKKVWHEGCNQD